LGPGTVEISSFLAPNGTRIKSITHGLGCAVFTTFFYSLLSESKQIWILFASYSHVSVYLQTPFIHIIRSYLLPNIRTNLHANIRFDAKMIHVEANIRFRANILFIFSRTSEYLLQNIGFEANFCKTLSEFHIQANICLQIFAYKGIFASKYSHSS
jgi:hypothetical protein